MMYYETDKKTFVSKNSDKGAYLLCVVAKEITVAGGSSFSFSCSAAAVTMVSAATTAAAITAAADAKIKRSIKTIDL